jgi:hypothetical protein
MRKLIVLSSDNYVRNLVTSGALAGIADEHGLVRAEDFHGGWSEPVPVGGL